MDKLNTLKYFCSAAETLQFRETALRLSVSPQAVTHVVAELEQHLDRQLSARDTRNIHLTEFGAAFLPCAQQLLADNENLFSATKEKDEIRGIVRIAVPQWNDNGRILAHLLEKRTGYPELYTDWRSNDARPNTVENQLDIGTRIGTQAEDLMIVRKIYDITDKIVASPAYLARYGTPQSLDELASRFPASSLINVNTSRPWGQPLNAEMHAFPKSLRFITGDPANELAAALTSGVAAYILEHLCRIHLQNDELLELFPEIPRRPWQLYIYRPQHTITSGRVSKVFNQLTEVLREMYGKRAT